jgi:hypothetical protein
MIRRNKRKVEIKQYYEYRIPMITNRIERLSNPDKKRMTIIGSVHGNEPVGYHALTEMLKNNEFDQYDNKLDFTIFPDSNEHGRLNNERNSLWGDINRSWPTTYDNPITSLIPPVKLMTPHIHNVDVVIDIHEAVGFSRCTHTLGNTLFISDPTKKDILQPIIDELNERTKDDKCDQWDIITCLPRVNGALDEYVAIIPEENRPLYILIEIPGQNDFQPLSKRIVTAKFLVHNIILTMDNLVQ